MSLTSKDLAQKLPLDGPWPWTASAECSAASSQRINLVGLRTCLGPPAHPVEDT